MKASELRIGNWVNDGRGVPMQVTGYDLYYYNNSNADNYSVMSSPIPLTPELLEKAGFEKDEDGVYRLLKTMYWLQEGFIQIALGYAVLYNIPCKHFHQLQNIYHSLTGEELKIKELEAVEKGIKF